MSKFTDAIEQNWPDYVISPGNSPEMECCQAAHDWADPENSDHWGMADEGSFSWSECESCGSKLGGDRYDAHAIHREAFGPNAKQPGNIHHIEICTDCILFHANGDEPDDWE